MNFINTKTLYYTLITSFAFAVAAIAPSSLAQDQEVARYSPEGRNIARGVASRFGDRTYEVRTYDPAADVAEFSAATIFYPLTLSFAPPIGAIAFVPGYRGSQQNYDWWGPMLASLGYAVMILDTNQPDDSLDARKQALIAAVDFLKQENEESDSPLQGKIDTNKIAIMGHSMGGGGVLHAANELGSNIKAAIPLSPYCCELGQSFSGDFGSLAVPTLVVASAEDTIAPPEGHAWTLYQSIGTSSAKAYMEFATGDHNIATNGGTDLVTLGTFALGWIKLNLDGDQRYAPLFDGGMGEENEARFSRFETTR